MYDMPLDEDYTLSKQLKGISVDYSVIKLGKREAKYKLIAKFCIAAKVKQEYALDLPLSIA